MELSRWNMVLICWCFILSLFIPQPVLSESEIITADCTELVSCLIHATSRSRLCLDLTGSPARCRVTGMVGGEHVTTIEVTGKADDSILLKFKSLSGKPGYTISGAGASIHRLGQGQVWVKLSGTSPLFEISISAHPYGEFEFNLRTMRPIKE